MLPWRTLSRSNRIAVVFFLVVLLPAAVLMAWAMPALPDRAKAIGGALTMLGVVLDPQFFSKPVLANIAFEKMPTVSRVLLALGVTTFFAGMLIGHYGAL